ncbi:MAG: hypothetical protein WCA00_01255, partial [Candidatus Acidiferrales bacterium]
PITAQPAAHVTPAGHAGVDLPLASAGRGLYPPSMTPAPTIPLSGSQPIARPISQSGIADHIPAPAPAANRRGIYIAISVVVVVAALIATGVAVVRLVRSSPAAHTISEPIPAVPDANVGAVPLNTPPCQPNDSRCWSHLPDGTPGKSAALAALRAKTSALPPPQNLTPPQEAPQQPVPQQIAPRQPSSTPDSRAAEQAARSTEEQVAQLAALEHEELDELTSNAKAVNVRVAALQKLQEAQGKQPPRDIAATQQRMDRDIALADSALRRADVQNAQKYMDQANAEMAKLKKFLGQ